MNTLKLLLPAVIPSWRFFDIIAPSPRIEYVLLETPDTAAENWREFRPRPATLPPTKMLARMFWNPHWNETLFLVSCAERLMSHPTEHSASEIFNRLKRDLLKKCPEQIEKKPFLQFRLVFHYRFETGMEKQVTFVSEIQRCTGNSF